MALVLNEEQNMLKTSAKELLKEKGSIAQLRDLRDQRDATGYSTELWSEMCELGFASVAIPEAYGGLDFGYTGLGQILEESGRTLTCSPLTSTILLSATAIHLGGNQLQKEALLPAIAEGSLIVGFAIDEGKHHRPFDILTTAAASGSQLIINGTKTLVLDGHVAQKYIVSAQDETGALILIVVDADSEGVQANREMMMDSRNAATVVFDSVKVDASAVLACYETGSALLQRVLDIGCTGLAAEMLGGMQEAFERTVAYLKEREQFGVKIGSFQALQHRAADMFCEIELCKSVVIKALKAIDENHKDISKFASLAKAKCGKIYRRVSNEGIQMYGGIGMTDDEEIGFFLKRARVAQQTLGDTNYHLDRLARMRGF